MPGGLCSRNCIKPEKPQDPSKEEQKFLINHLVCILLQAQSSGVGALVRWSTGPTSLAMVVTNSGQDFSRTGRWRKLWVSPSMEFSPASPSTGTTSLFPNPTPTYILLVFCLEALLKASFAFPLLDRSSCLDFLRTPPGTYCDRSLMSIFLFPYHKLRKQWLNRSDWIAVRGST